MANRNPYPSASNVKEARFSAAGWTLVKGSTVPTKDYSTDEIAGGLDDDKKSNLDNIARCAARLYWKRVGKKPTSSPTKIPPAFYFKIPKSAVHMIKLFKQVHGYNIEEVDILMMKNFEEFFKIISPKIFSQLHVSGLDQQTTSAFIEGVYDSKLLRIREDFREYDEGDREAVSRLFSHLNEFRNQAPPPYIEIEPSMEELAFFEHVFIDELILISGTNH